MTKIKLFRLKSRTAEEISGGTERLELSLQKTIDQRLYPMLRIKRVASQFAPGRHRGGKIDSVGIDQNNRPVIIEYKRRTVSSRAIYQAQEYVGLLLDNRPEFELRVQRKWQQSNAVPIDWTSPRLLCIAGGFTSDTQRALKGIKYNIELIRYRKFGKDLLMLEWVRGAPPDRVLSDDSSFAVRPSGKKKKTISDVLDSLDQQLADLYEALRRHLLALGDDVQERTLENYVAFSRPRNFACVEVRVRKREIRLYLKVNPDMIQLETGFTRSVRGTGHYGTGDLQVTIRSLRDLERAKRLIHRSYDDT